MSTGNACSVVQQPLAESDQAVFFDILLHDDRKSFYTLSSVKHGIWREESLSSEQLRHLSFEPGVDYYVTHNGFTGKQRKLERTRQLNALFFDLDCHKLSPAACADAVDQALCALTDAIEGAIIPNPSLIACSGRGLHLYYVLERSIPYRFKGTGELNERGITFFKDVQERLGQVLAEVVDGIEGMEVDRAVFDHTRVARIPGTYNSAAGCQAYLVNASSAYHHLTDLASYKPLDQHSKSGQLAAKKPATIINFNRLMMSRLSKVTELQEYRHFDCEGVRELMGFVFYNTAVQIYNKEDAKMRLEAFNGRFKKPLPRAELRGIVNAVSEVVNVSGIKGYYLLKADTLVRLLHLTKQEMDDLQFFASKRMMERMEAKKRTKEKRAKRDARIVELYRAGQMTQQEVACAVGCSPRTVATVLKKEGLTSSHTNAHKQSKQPQPSTLPAPRVRDRIQTLIGSQADCETSAAFYFCRAFAKKWHPCQGVMSLGGTRPKSWTTIQTRYRMRLGHVRTECSQGSSGLPLFKARKDPDRYNRPFWVSPTENPTPLGHGGSQELRGWKT